MMQRDWKYAAMRTPWVFSACKLITNDCRAVELLSGDVRSSDTDHCRNEVAGEEKVRFRGELISRLARRNTFAGSVSCYRYWKTYTRNDL